MAPSDTSNTAPIRREPGPVSDVPDTGLQEFLKDHVYDGEFPPLEAIKGIPDFEYVARSKLSAASYAFFRTGSAGEYSYRNNFEVFRKLHFRPRMLNDVSNVINTLPTTILGHKFSAPFFIAPAGLAGHSHPDAEVALTRGAHAGNILYVPALYATLSIEEIAAAKGPDQVLFQQLYTPSDFGLVKEYVQRAEKAGSKAIVYTIDAPVTSTRHRADRYSHGNANAHSAVLTWDLFRTIQGLTSLPVIPKGIATVEDAKLAIQNGAPAIYISNHGGRQLDGSPSPLEIALEIHREAPEIFSQVDVLADGGVRYGTDILKLLALGIKAVGLGRSFLYANVYGQPGVEKAISILKKEIAADAANLGVSDLKKINTSF
ncbi:FMN-dependent dehydrogenase-like protein 1 [Elsinoe australis]|uniref:FMN-dependent dehydrogenase-like protein 1 n=1 Tax=Elsinoe australis TaxID=40998 RepID=A0A4U7B651_9PEZI|nr:FMN-dependent dehydrogenase-like protein 1 [Elsinoe australis]